MQHVVDTSGIWPAGTCSGPLQVACRDADALARTAYGLPRGAILRATLRREVTLMKRNRFIYIFRTSQVGRPTKRGSSRCAAKRRGSPVHAKCSGHCERDLVSAV